MISDPDILEGLRVIQQGPRRRKHKQLHLTFYQRRAEKERLLKVQGGTCAICSTPLWISSSHLDHDHSTGHIRGLLCRGCNMLLGVAHDDPKLLQEAAKYVQNKVEGPACNSGSTYSII